MALYTCLSSTKLLRALVARRSGPANLACFIVARCNRGSRSSVKRLDCRRHLTHADYVTKMLFIWLIDSEKHDWLRRDGVKNDVYEYEIRRLLL